MPSTTPSTPAPVCRATTSPTPTWCSCTATPRGREMGQRHDRADHTDHGHAHHEHPGVLRGWATGLVHPHGHDAADSVDAELESSARGIRAVKTGLVALGVTS